MIRRARESDAEAWVRLAVSMEKYYPGLDPDQHARIVRKCARSGEALVAEWNGAFAGGLLYSRKHEELSFLMVAPWARRHSLARAMVQEMLGDFPGGSVIRVTTYRADDPLGDAARPFYESLGFVPGAEIVSHGYPEQEFSLFLPLLTERLALRPFRAGDFEAFCVLLDLPELPGWGMQKHRAREFLDWYITSAQRMDVQNGVICLGAFGRLTGELCGFAGVGRHDDLGEPEVFYAFQPSARGKGYATEACRAVSEWALARFDIPQLIGTAGVENAASRRVLEKCGYEFVDVRTLDVRITGERYDFAYYLRGRPEIAPHGDDFRGADTRDKPL